MEKSYGSTNLENNIVNDADSVFEWGSCTKLLTWTSVMQLVEDGKLDLNKDIREYLPKDFFHKLNYKDPITMLNLMNHNAGWQEMATDLFLGDKKDIKELGDALRYIEPEQVNRPGTVVAYSNWGAALAGYIVECVSGQSFSDYVHQNIFEPLGMDHTALFADLSDNQWVYDKRILENCYSTENQSLGTCLNYLSLYPAGMATGTLSDFVKFASTFIPKDGISSPLFKKADTLNMMLSPSLNYGDNKTARNCHGFWTDTYKVPVLWHNGGTIGSSSWFAFNRETGTGMVVLTNQKGESIYNCGILPLVFGNPDKTKAVSASKDISGVYVNSQGIFRGYAKLYSLLSVMNITSNIDGTYVIKGSDITISDNNKDSFLMDMGGLKQFVLYISENNGKLLLQSNASDYIQMNGKVIIGKYVLLLLYFIASIYSFFVLFALLIRSLLHKPAKPMSRLRTLTNLSVILSSALFVSVALHLMSSQNALYRDVQWRLVLCIILALAPLIFIILLCVQWKRLNCSTRAKISLIINCLMGLIMTFNIFYWVL